jgi:hypothetical protein
MISKNKKMKGGVIYRPVDQNDPKYSLPKDVFYKYFKKGLLSERELHKFNKEYIKLILKYKLKIETHLENLNDMDAAFGDNINNPNFHGFIKSFEILSSNNTLDDSLQPLLLKNYEYISEHDNDINIIEYFLDQQFSYLIFNYYNETEQRMFSSIIFKNLMTQPEFQVITSDGKLTDFLPLPHTNYELDYVKTKKILDQIISFLKKSTDIKRFKDEPPLLITLPSESLAHVKTNEALVNDVLCKQAIVSVNNKLSKKIIKKGSKKEKKSNQSSKVNKPSMEKIHIATETNPTITNGDGKNEIKDKKISYKISRKASHKVSHKVSKKIVPDFTPTQESINPSINQQINNPIPTQNDVKEQIIPEKPNIQDIKLPKTAGLPAFKIELPEKKVMIPFEKK